MVAECCLDCTCDVVLKGAPLSLGTKFENHDVQFEYALSLPKALCPNSKNKEFTVSIRHVYQHNELLSIRHISMAFSVFVTFSVPQISAV